MARPASDPPQPPARTPIDSTPASGQTEPSDWACAESAPYTQWSSPTRVSPRASSVASSGQARSRAGATRTRTVSRVVTARAAATSTTIAAGWATGPLRRSMAAMTAIHVQAAHRKAASADSRPRSSASSSAGGPLRRASTAIIASA
jgi:hypothetical protein